MEFTLDQILDIPLLQSLQDKLNEINPFPSALIDNSGKILTSTAWQDICTKFHRVHPDSERECILSDQYIINHMAEANPAVSYKCPHGMVDNAIPIIVEGYHIANFFTGQFFLEPPDPVFFREQASRYGFDEEAYMEAVARVPVWNMEKRNHYLDFMKTFTESLAQMGLTRLRESEASRVAAENERRFRSIVENTLAGYFFIDRDGIIRDVNDSWVKMYKYDSRDEIVGHQFAEIQQLEDVDLAKEFVERIMAGDQQYFYGEFNRKCKDGSVGYHTFSARPVIIEGEVTGIEGFILDSTRLKLAEMERDLSRTRLTSVFEKMTEGFALHEIICDENGKPVDYRFLDLNPAFARLTGLNVDEIIGKTATEVLPGLEDSWIERYGAVALTGIPVTFDNFVASLNRHFRVVAFSNQRGQFATIFDDISDIMQSEEKLKTLAMAIDSIKECVSMTDTENTILFVNRAFCNTYGYSSDELVGRNISMVRSPANNTLQLEEILDNTIGGGWDGEVMNRRKDGTDFPVHISTAKVADKNDQPIALIGIAVDITERKKNEEELIAAKERAEESDRLKSAFLANISHEIRTPMNSILGFSELLEEIVDDPVQLGYLRIISNGGERLLNIINSVIDIAKIESGQENLSPVEFDVNSLLDDLYELNKRRNPAISFINDMASHDSLPMFTDKTKLFQILNNLLSNALKYTKKGGVNFGYTIDSGFITFYVKDTGIGIPSEFSSKIYKRFQKVEFKDRTDFEGTGLGLAITKELVSMLKGEIRFDSAPDKGTTFFVKFPV